MHHRESGGIVLAAAGLAAAVLVVIGAGAARPRSPAPRAAPPPSPQASPTPSPQASPAPGETSAAPTPPAASPTPALPAEPPRIVRTVCTDHVCGGCDGKCRKSSGHVAVDKKGHCACTPAEGSDLDRAVRQAYERHPPR